MVILRSMEMEEDERGYGGVGSERGKFRFRMSGLILVTWWLGL